MREERAHKSLWTTTAATNGYPRLAGNLTVDVAVVGGGIAGLTTAYLLKRAGKRVAVLEMHAVLTGQTGQTTAHLTEVLDVGYSQIASDFGRKGAALAAASQRAAIEQIASLVEELRIDCGFRRVPAYVYTERDGHVRGLERELVAMREAGIIASPTREVPLPYPVKAALRIERQAQVHPREYLRVLAEAIQGDGSNVFEGTRALEVVDGEPCQVRTPAGTVFAGEVVEATTTPLNRVLLHTKLYPYRTYAVAAPLEGPLEPGLYWDTEDPYHYIRTQRVGDVDYLIVGGEDHKTGHEEQTGTHFERLEAYTLQRFPVSRISHRWSGQVIEPADGLAYIGRNGGRRHVYVATGFSGNGMTYGTLSGMILSDRILGRESPYAALYEATRVKPKAAAKDFIQENADVAFRFVADRLSRPGARELSEVQPGEGKIVEVAGKKVAVYRQENGACHAVSPVCTHLGCHVHWNRAERSWDCPCHGARYSPTGKVFNGPAVKDLPSVQLPDPEGVKGEEG